MNDFFSIYDAIEAGIPRGTTVERAIYGSKWSAAESSGHIGLAMADSLETLPPMFPEGPVALDVKDAAKAVRSWNIREASLSLAAANSVYNTPEHMRELDSAEPYENYCTAGLDLRGKVIAAIGHLHMTQEIREDAKEIYIIERSPRPGDYPDAACDLILPRCDIVLITGSSIINKTLPHLLELCRNAVTILIGPSVPMCPALLDCGIDRLSGMVVTDTAGMREHVLTGTGGNPYKFGQSWLLKR